MIRAGQLRHQVTIEQRQTGKDASGQPVDLWSPVITAMAQIQPLNGREFFESAGYGSEVTTRIRLRWEPALDSVTPADRVVSDTGSVYGIESIINIHERNFEVVIMAVETDRGRS